MDDLASPAQRQYRADVGDLNNSLGAGEANRSPGETHQGNSVDAPVRVLPHINKRR